MEAGGIVCNVRADILVGAGWSLLAGGRMSEEGGEKRPRKPYKRPLSAHETRKLRAFNILKSKFQMLKWDLHQQGVRAIGLSTEGDLLLERSEEHTSEL